MTPKTSDYNTLQRTLLNNFQSDFPISSRPYAELAARIGVSERDVIQTLKDLHDKKIISRVGPVFRVGSIGCSTLAAMAVPEAELHRIATIVNQFDAVNHNYERENKFNLWFVATAENEAELQDIIQDIESRTGYEVMVLPMLEDYHIDLGFELLWT
jgi:DNA-binding Lrp family transcriptional regulator